MQNLSIVCATHDLPFAELTVGTAGDAVCLNMGPASILWQGAREELAVLLEFAAGLVRGTDPERINDIPADAWRDAFRDLYRFTISIDPEPMAPSAYLTPFLSDRYATQIDTACADITKEG
jgi:hypothetical protein